MVRLESMFLKKLLLGMRARRSPPSRTRSSAHSSGGCPNSNSGIRQRKASCTVANVYCFWQHLTTFCLSLFAFIPHMVKYRYLPFTHGKRTYRGKEDTGKPFAS
ncbi:unnamed protein product [Oncorhynchus mykiss]|uniref:Uncharacterized protein n=1 Tax=Oncorhynchus mykiss TaxID=8022 RepID=A0A060XDT3_ONCMY|nr:unnamed protein product [Oncorhynchus mykiss]